MSARAAGPSWWVPGDWNGFFGLFTNVALNVIVLTGLCLGVVKLPDDVVFGRILPALGVALPIGNLFYGWMAWQLAKRQGRDDVTALPYGPSVPHIAFLSLGIILIAWCARVRLPGGVPGGLAAVLVGTALAWLATFSGIDPLMDP